MCLEMLQCEGFGVTKERCECVCTLSAFTAPCVELNGKFYLVGTGSVLELHGHSSSPGPAAGELVCAGDAAGSCLAMDLGQELCGAPRR